jgi:hypothetical protein
MIAVVDRIPDDKGGRVQIGYFLVQILGFFSISNLAQTFATN